MGRGRGKKGQKKQEQNSVEKINGQMYAGVRKANALADAKNAQEDEDEFAAISLAANDSKEERENDGAAVIDIDGSGEIETEELAVSKEDAIAAAKARIDEVIELEAEGARVKLSPQVRKRSTLSWAHSFCFLKRFADKGHPLYVMYSNLV